MLLMCQESNEPFDFHTSEWFIITSIHISLYIFTLYPKNIDFGKLQPCQS